MERQHLLPFAASSTVINTDKVILTGQGLYQAKVHQRAEFVIDGTEAGWGAFLSLLYAFSKSAAIDEIRISSCYGPTSRALHTLMKIHASMLTLDFFLKKGMEFCITLIQLLVYYGESAY